MSDNSIPSSIKNHRSPLEEKNTTRSRIWMLLSRPEAGAVGGTIVIMVLFAIFADARLFSLAGLLSFLEPASQLGILAIAVALLMIGGEFDLSLGSMVAFGGMVLGIALVAWNFPLPFAILCAFTSAILVGVLNATIVIRTQLPSFIVTLAFLYILRGLTLIGLKAATGGATQLRELTPSIDMDGWLYQSLSGNAFEGLFRILADQGWIATFSSGMPKVSGVPVEVLWFLGFALLAHHVLQRTPFGNWILATGGDAEAARRVGVPVKRVKVILFCITACAATLVGIMNALDFNSTDASRGTLKEFEAIIAAVIGGCLLTGGHGSVIGTFLGAVIFGLVSVGISYTSIDYDWFKVFLGGMLLTSVLINHYVKKILLPTSQ